MSLPRPTAARPAARLARAGALGAAVPLALAACADRAPVGPAPRPGGAPRADVVAAAGPGRYLVAVDPAAPGDPLAAALAAAGGRVVDSVPALHLAVVDGVAHPAALGVPGVRYAEPDAWVTAGPVDAAPADATADAAPAAEAAPAGPPAAAPWFANGVQWGMRAVRADAAWAAGATGAGATVCVVDSGVDDLHQELAGRVARSQSFVPNNRVDGAAGYSEVRLDSAGHGTHVASTAVGNGVVVASAAPDATLITAKVLDQTNSGLFAWILPGMTWCADQGAHVMNVSIGGILYLANGVPPEANALWRAVADAVRYATDRGTVVVISAGNSNLQLPNPNQYVVPAQAPGAVVVGATGPVTRMVGTVSGGALLNVPIAAPPAWNPADPSQVWQGPDGRAFYSNFGAAVDVFAPGGRGGIPATFLRRVALVPPGTVRSPQGSAFDNVFAACSRVGAYAGAPDVGGVPGAFGSCAGASNRYAALAGTSMAAPHVTGLAALLYAELGGAPSPANRARVEACLRTTADAVGPSEIFGRGRVNAERALGALREGRC